MTQVSATTRKRRSQIRTAEFALPQKIGNAPRDGWWWASIIILIAATGLRLIFLTQKPLHHDEGVNGNFLVNLFRTGYYHYDPANYHGPTLYYLAVLPSAVNNLFHWGHGLSTFAIRFVTAAFGVGVVWLMLCLRRFVGKTAAVAAAALATVSPGFVFFSRYFIHEILFVFFSLGVIVAWLWYRETNKPRYLMLASASAAMLFATKETWIITAAVWLIAVPCTAFYLRLRKRADDGAARMREAVTSNDSGRNTTQLYLKAAALFAAIGLLFYSSFFTNPKGILDSVRTFTYWTKTGQTGIYNREWSTYLGWLFREEAPVLILGGLGTLVALLRARNYLTVFCAFWSIGIFAAYSLVPYKTPWLVLSIILPLTIMAGHLIGEAYQPGLRAFTVVVAGAAIVFSLYQAIDISFVNFDNDGSCGGVPCYPYVYAHTNRDFLGLVNEIQSIAAANPAKKDIGITVMSPEHWPLPWYMREYPHVGYWGRIVPTSEPIVIALKSQAPQVQQQLGGAYRLFSTHELRPGNTLLMFVRNDIRQ
ncbi:MAG TPA: flippase activity-associated protein Agl23 [Candidatus Angelobacter sp.]|nr:flippase activity-associated protein Agl23 [Candidatus Angelobacter sp.]